MNHAPVMCDEAVSDLAVKPGGVYLDATFGAGGYSRAILAAGAGRLIALDRDPTVARNVDPLLTATGSRLAFFCLSFSEMAVAVEEAGVPALDGVVMDVGVSSMQLDDPERGFSFRGEGPLDMRMAGVGESAAELLARASQSDLAQVFRAYGEERQARRAAAAIVKARSERPIDTTAKLASLMEETLGPGDGRIHPATRVFQALRIAVNDELGELAAGLAAAERLLAPGGRLVAVTFHSLEDRIVKNFLRRRSGREAGGSRHAPDTRDLRAPSFSLVRPRPMAPSEAEVAANPRARSAKLRSAERTDAAAWADDDDHAAPRPRLMYREVA